MNSTPNRSFFDEEGTYPADMSAVNARFRSPLLDEGEGGFLDPEFSGAVPRVQPGESFNPQGTSPPSLSFIAPRGRRRGRRVSLILRLLLILLALLIVGSISITAYFSGNVVVLPIVQHADPPQHAATPGRPTPVPTATPVASAQASPTAIPPRPGLIVALPVGWGNRSPLDAENALQVGWTFTQREMRIDYRDVGTLAEIGGTLTAAVFLLDTNARELRFPNDRRTTSAYFALVQQEQLIQTPVFDNPPFTSHPQILQAQTTQDGNFFVWVVVPFELVSQQGVQGQPDLDPDPVSQQPRVHTMQVLLINVPSGAGPMAGVDYEVSDYALDAPPGSIIQIPALP